MEKNNKVVYRHVRLDTNEVFYIGAGDYERAFRNGKKRNILWNDIVNTTEYRVDILFDNLTLEEAHKKEREFIQLYGRKDLGLGTLINMTDGGRGSLGLKTSDDTKIKIGEFNKGKILSDETKLKIGQGNKGKARTEETKLKISQSKKGIKHSEETRLKMSESAKSRKRKS